MAQHPREPSPALLPPGINFEQTREGKRATENMEKSDCVVLKIRSQHLGQAFRKHQRREELSYRKQLWHKHRQVRTSRGKIYCENPVRVSSPHGQKTELTQNTARSPNWPKLVRTFGQQLKTQSYRLAEESRELRLLFLTTQQFLKNKKGISRIQKK